MNKELLNNLKNYSVEDLENFLENEVLELCKEAYDGSLSGWRYLIYMDSTHFWVCGPVSNGTMSMDEYEGNSVRVGTVELCKELGEVVHDYDIDNLNDEELNDLKNFIKDNNDEYKIDKEDFKDLSTKELIYDNCLNVDLLFRDWNEEKYEEIKADLIEEYAKEDLEMLEDDIIRNISEAIEVMEFEDEEER